MKKINKLLCILISILMITSSVSLVGFSADYENHWAKDSISTLLSSGVISGDADGSIRPDDKILRAEYVKVINKYFGYTEASTENFSDVDAGEWYYNDFAIAKKAGYITGDEKGNANPKAYITRAEVCVILSRILGLKENAALNFSDEEKIPSWAKGYIGAMVEKGYISGYSDGTVRADSNITRAEAFSIVTRVPKADNTKPEETTDVQVNNPGNTSSMISINTSSGGGGGGGGGSSRPKPDVGGNIIKRYAEISLRNFSATDYSVEFDTENAKSVTIKIEIKNDTFSSEFTIADEVVSKVFKGNILDALKDVLLSRMNEDDIFVISAKANGKTGFSDSKYVKVTELSYDFEEVAAPVVETNIDYQNLKVTASWTPDEKAASYEVKVYNNDVDITDTVDLSELASGKVTVVYTGDLLSFFETNYRFEVIAKGQELIKDSSLVTANADPSMEKLDAPVLAEAIDYDNNEITVTWPVDEKAVSYDVKVYSNTSETSEGVSVTDGKVVVAAGDKIEEFYSSEYKIVVKAIGNLSELIGDSDEASVSLDNTVITGAGTEADPYCIRSGVQFTRIFAEDADSFLTNSSGKYFKQTNDITLDDYTPSSVTFSGIYDGGNNKVTIKKYTSTGSNIQGLISKTSASSIIKNLTLSGTIDCTGREQIGGFVGYCLGTVINCVNEADILGKAYIGGIAGRIQAGGKLINCINLGNITSSNSYIGGIVGDAVKADNYIINCANYGAITDQATANRLFNGGIIGRAQGVTIEKCFNAGTVTKNGTAGAVSAIVGSNNSTADIVIKDCFNTGELVGGASRNLVYAGFTSGTVKITVENFYDIANASLALTPTASGITLTQKGSILVLGGDVTKDTIVNAYIDNEAYECTQDDGYDYPNFAKTEDVTVVYDSTCLN